MTGGFVVSVVTPDGSEETINVAEIASLTVGRDPSCHIVLPSPAVSRVHLRVERTIGGVRVVDQSSNGTILGDEPVCASGMPLCPGEELRVGPYVLRIAPLVSEKARGDASPDLRRQIHRSLLDHLDLASLGGADMDEAVLRPRVVRALDQIVSRLAPELHPATDRERLVAEMTD